MSSSSKVHRDPVNAGIVEQAVEWFLENREKDSMSPERRRKFLLWLQTSPVHVREYLAIAKSSLDLRSFAQNNSLTAEALVEAARIEDCDNKVVQFAPVSQSTVPHRRPINLQRFGALAAGVVAVVVGASWWLTMRYQSMPTEFRTAHGEQRTVPLEDGSVLHINSDSRIRVDFSRSERRVAVEEGQALFKVAKDASRPFRVRAGETEVVAVGTEFDVRRQKDEVVVTVVEGRVAVSDKAGSVAGAAARVPIRVGAGEQTRVKQGVFKSMPRVVDVRPEIAWVQQQIMFEREPLGRVVEEFNRYGSMPIVIEGSGLDELRISGVFNAYDLDSFVAYLEHVNGLVVRRDGDRVRILISHNKVGESRI